MADNAIRKKTDAILKNEKNLSKVKEELKAQCRHTHHGEPTFVPSNEPRAQGELKYICKQCQKVITISSISDEDLHKACNIIDQAIDIVKITAGTANTEDDAELIGKLAKMQYRVRNVIEPAYKAAIKRGNRRNDRQRDRSEDSLWGRPNISGHRDY